MKKQSIERHRTDVPIDVLASMGAFGPPMSVWTQPGWMATQRMPSGSKSTARLLEIMFITTCKIVCQATEAPHKVITLLERYA